MPKYLHESLRAIHSKRGEARSIFTIGLFWWLLTMADEVEDGVIVRLENVSSK